MDETWELFELDSNQTVLKNSACSIFVSVVVAHVKVKTNKIS